MIYYMKQIRRKNKKIRSVAQDFSEYGMNQVFLPLLALTQTLVLILTLFVQRTFVLSTAEGGFESSAHFDLKLENHWA